MTAHRFGPLDRLRGLARASHPFPIAMVMSLTVITGVASGPFDAGRLALASLAMFLSQLSIGWSNDYLDRRHDAAHRPDKPVPAGVVPAAALPPLTLAAIAGSFAAGVPLGAGVLLLLAAGTSAGFAYNVYLKRTPMSWTAYLLAFAVLPPFVWSALDQFRAELWWLYPIGAPLVIAAHVANTLPDIEGDRSGGHSGAVVRLGRPSALRLLFASLALPPLTIAASLLWLDYSAALLTAALAVYAVLVAAAAVAYRGSPFRAAAARGFLLVAPAAVLLAGGWLAAV